MEKLTKFAPDLHRKSLDGVKPITEDYNSFDISAFYQFCRTHPADGEDQ